ncbi:universal stress protein [Hasllibacter sp. MH4015]|uniref:universal stress protein n=1 Tax=Hasllibacter sp. MH4015 TaxID=2854029 RepID=UPI001CD42F3E|nr:universal stress protein [Hasllibacter sp. MH4015]
MFTSILVAIDGSEPSRHALKTACGLAKAFGAELHLLHAPQIETMAIAVGAAVVDVPVTPERIAEAGKGVMEDAVKRATEEGITVASDTIGSGDAVDNILDTAKLNSADLIVMGRRGLGSVASLFLGSVSQKVSHGAKCSVLTVG